ncbi:MAG TPA: peptide chain release factor N(5)-glutamine methyltransferase [Rhizomicrobium sp.]|nr:peptide chain release factor N(5)-glutamine methyltransferase [Rhizomicrobium sp.]
MTPSLREALTRGMARLQAADIESARLDARVLLSHALGIASDGLFPPESRADQIESFESLVTRRAAREPLAYIIGRKEFWSLDFEVGPGVLIPRPETETLVEEALRQFPDAKRPLNVLDMGTGSGCLLIAFLMERQNAGGLGIDVSEAALACARRNAARHGLSARCDFDAVVSPLGHQEHQGNSARATRSDSSCSRRLDGQFFPQNPGSADQFDVILANPPYLTDEEFAASMAEIREYEPCQALAAGPDGLVAMRTFVPAFTRLLAPAGLAFLEIGAGQAEEVAEIVTDAGLEVRRMVSDLSGIPRCLAIGRAGEGCVRRP